MMCSPIEATELAELAGSLQKQRDTLNQLVDLERSQISLLTNIKKKCQTKLVQLIGDITEEQEKSVSCSVAFLEKTKDVWEQLVKVSKTTNPQLTELESVFSLMQSSFQHNERPNENPRKVKISPRGKAQLSFSEQSEPDQSEIGGSNQSKGAEGGAEGEGGEGKSTPKPFSKAPTRNTSWMRLPKYTINQSEKVTPGVEAEDKKTATIKGSARGGARGNGKVSARGESSPTEGGEGDKSHRKNRSKRASNYGLSRSIRKSKIDRTKKKTLKEDFFSEKSESTFEEFNILTLEELLLLLVEPPPLSGLTTASTSFLSPFFLTYYTICPPNEILSFLIEQLNKAKKDDKKGRVAEAMRYWVDECGTTLEDEFWQEKEKIDTLIQGVSEWKEEKGKRLKSVVAAKQKLWEGKLKAEKQMRKLKKEKLSQLDWVNYDDYGISISLTMHEFDLFSLIKMSELVNWHKKDKNGKCENMSRLIAFSNSISGWVTSELVQRPKVSDRVLLLQKFISIGEHLLELNNFSSLMAIIAGLNNASSRRMKKTWQALDPEFEKKLERMETVMSHNQGFVSFRAHLKECSRPCIPYMGMYLTDLTFIEEGNKDSGDQINFNKRRMIGDVIKQVIYYQSEKYTIARPKNKFIPALVNYKVLSEDECYKFSKLVDPKDPEEAMETMFNKEKELSLKLSKAVGEIKALKEKLAKEGIIEEETDDEIDKLAAVSAPPSVPALPSLDPIQTEVHRVTSVPSVHTPPPPQSTTPRDSQVTRMNSTPSPRTPKSTDGVKLTPRTCSTPTPRSNPSTPRSNPSTPRNSMPPSPFSSSISLASTPPPQSTPSSSTPPPLPIALPPTPPSALPPAPLQLPPHINSSSPLPPSSVASLPPPPLNPISSSLGSNAYSSSLPQLPTFTSLPPSLSQNSLPKPPISPLPPCDPDQ